MTIEQALKILELKGKPSLEQIKHQYRILAKKYHPDLHSKYSSPEMFILINAAYELLIKKRYFSDYSDNVEDTFNEDEVLSFRINVINTAFKQTANDYQIYFFREWENLNTSLLKKIDKYCSKEHIRENFKGYFTENTENTISDIVSWYNDRLDSIVNRYNDWIYGYIDKTSEALKKEEIHYFFLSKSFNILFVSNMSLAAIIIYFLNDLQDFSLFGISLYIVIPIMAILFTIILFKYKLENKYSRTQFQLNRNAFHLTPQMVNFDSIASLSFPTLSAGSISNAATHVGGMSGHFGLGLLTMVGGALINGAISLWNAVTDDSLSTLKTTAAKQCKDNLSLVHSMISTNLNSQLSDIKDNIIENITNSYNSAKTALVSGFLQRTSVRLIEKYCNKEA